MLVTAGVLGCAGTEFSATDLTPEPDGAGGGAMDAPAELRVDGSPDRAIPGAPDASLDVSVDTTNFDDRASPPTMDCGPGATASRCLADAEIPSTGLAIWLSADVGVVVTNGHVVRWQDRSGSGYDATQAVLMYQPVLASAWSEGRSSVFFDGIDDFLALSSGLADFSRGLSLFLVGDIVKEATCPSFVHFSNGGEVDDISLHREPSDTFQYEVADQSFLSEPDSLVLGKPALLTVVHRPDQRADLYSNGALSGEIPMVLPAQHSRARNDLARSSYVNCEFLNGHIAEIVLYARSLEDAERVKVEAYLRTKWAL